MIDISKWAFENKKLIYFLIAVLIVGGAYSSYEMSKLEDPEVTVKVAMVVTTYPGASAHQVELEVTDVLEKNIRTMGNIDNVESYSYNDLSLIQVELKTTVKEADVEQCWDLLRRKVANAQAELPEGAATPLVKDDFGNVYGMFYALTGDGLQDRELSDYAELIKREVSELDGVERVDLYGKREECINISLLQDRMANLGVKPAEVLATLNGQNKTTYTGYYDNGCVCSCNCFFHFSYEIKVSRSVQNIDLHIIPDNRYNRSIDGKLTFDLLFIVITDGSAVGNFTKTSGQTGHICHRLDQTGLAASPMS